MFLSRWVVFSMGMLMGAGSFAVEKPLCETAFELADASDLEIQLEEHSLADVAKLAEAHPHLALDPYHRALSWILSIPEEQRPHPHIAGKTIRYFPNLSRATQFNGGRYIVGKEEEIQRFVEMLENRTRGLPVLVGPPATGKSEFIHVFRGLAASLSRRSPRHYEYTFVFKNLHIIPSLEDEVQLDAEGNALPRVLEFPESPIVLLPEAMKQEVMEEANAYTGELDGFTVSPLLEPSPVSKKIRDEILQYYARERGVQSFTPEEELELLSQHVSVRRLVFSEVNMPIIDADHEFDFASVFLRRRTDRLHLPTSDPFAVSYGGKALQANLTVLFLDEVLRQKDGVLNTLLGPIESQRLNTSVGPSVPLSTLYIGATNTSSWEKKAKEADNTAFFSRLQPIQMNWSTHPWEIVHTALLDLQKQQGIFMKRLGDANAEWEPADLSVVFPEPEGGVPVQGTDGRYRLAFGVGSRRVEVMPHALMAIGAIAAVTRMELDAQKAMTVRPELARGGEGALLRSALFRSPIERLRFMNHETVHNPIETSQYLSLFTSLHEGAHGMDQRHVGRVWLTRAIAEARRSPSRVVTLATVARVLSKSVAVGANGGIVAPDAETAARWKVSYLPAVLMGYIFPRIEADLSAAVGSMSGRIDALYEKVLDEIAEKEDAEREGRAWRGSTDVRQVLEVFKRQTGRELSTSYLHRFRRMAQGLNRGAGQQTVNFASGAHQRGGGREDKARVEDLLRAVRAFVQSQFANGVAFDAELIRYLEGGEVSSDVRARGDRLAEILEVQYGYPRSILAEYWKFKKELEEQVAPARR